MFDLSVIALLCLFYAKGSQAIIAWEHRKQRWQEADAKQRERSVRDECAWRLIGRLIGAGSLVGAFVLASPVLSVMWGLGAWRLIKGMQDEMRDACSYRSTGRRDEPPYSW